MRILAIAMLLLTGCVSVSAGRPKEQQYPTWVQELAERRASLAESMRAQPRPDESGRAEALEAEAEPEAEAEGDAESVAARPLPTVRTSAAVVRPTPTSRSEVARKPRSEMNGPEKIQEGIRLLREANEKRQQAARLMDEEEPRLSREREELRRQRREFDR